MPDRPPVSAENVPESAVWAGARRLAAGSWQAPDGTRCHPDEIAHGVLSGVLSEGYRLVRDDEATVERMAKSLWRGAGPTGRVTWEELPREVVRYWQREARAALTEALRGED